MVFNTKRNTIFITGLMATQTQSLSSLSAVGQVSTHRLFSLMKPSRKLLEEDAPAPCLMTGSPGGSPAQSYCQEGSSMSQRSKGKRKGMIHATSTTPKLGAKQLTASGNTSVADAKTPNMGAPAAPKPGWWQTIPRPKYMCYN
jgi:hypothetical protein